VFDVERVKQETRGGYVWHGFKVSRKPELCFTNSRENPRKWGEHRLTKVGLLKANKTDTGDTFISFKEYQRKVDKIEQERAGTLKGRKKQAGKTAEKELELPISIITGS